MSQIFFRICIYLARQGVDFSHLRKALDGDCDWGEIKTQNLQEAHRKEIVKKRYKQTNKSSNHLFMTKACGNLSDRMLQVVITTTLTWSLSFSTGSKMGDSSTSVVFGQPQPAEWQRWVPLPFQNVFCGSRPIFLAGFSRQCEPGPVGPREEHWSHPESDRVEHARFLLSPGWKNPVNSL